MTKKIAISVPDDVAERLAHEPNVSAYITEAVRGRMAGEQTRQILNAAGFAITDDDMERAGQEIDRAYANVTPELLAHAARLYAEITRGRTRAAGAHPAEVIERIRQHRAGAA
jgi:hypothetical protein